MKKLLSFTVVTLLLMGGGWFWYEQSYGTTDYYTKITSKGERVSIGRGSGRERFRYKYNLASYTSDNNEKDVSFNSYGDKPLKENAYLVLHVNNHKGVMGWEEVSPNDVPSAILNKLG